MRGVRLGPGEREAALARLADDEFDVLVIGGGVVGAGTALDAATRGLAVGLVEAQDFAAGTSSRSSKLIHGGLRYLEMLDFGLVREALRERGLLIRRIAPHLVRQVPFLYPLTHRGWERAYTGAGVALYDTLGTFGGHARGLPRHRHLTRHQALSVAPSLRRDALVGAVHYYDAQVDDARHTFSLVRTAASYGAQCASRARVTGFLREGGRVTGVEVRDLESGRIFRVRARQVVNATGVWTDRTHGLLGGAAGETGRFHVRASKGIHLVVPRERVRSSAGLILRTETSVLFVIPWGRHWIIGTTDTDWSGDLAHPAATSADIGYLLEHVNRVLRVPLTRDDVEGVYAGLRPLLAGDSEQTARLSREHVVGRVAPGLVVVTGGKYTTYRVMAKDAVDEAARGMEGHVAASCTHEVPLLGADGFHALWNGRRRIAARSGLPVARVEHLLRRYGSLVDEVLDLITADESLAKPLDGAEDYLRAEVVYAASHEGARHLDDILSRRLRASIETFDRGLAAAGPAALLAASVLGWDAADVRREVAHFAALVDAERRSQQEQDDFAAEAVRLTVQDIVPAE